MLAALAGAALVRAPLLATAQKPFDFGKREHESNCAVCHGATGKGDGPQMKYLAYIGKGVGDRTLIAKRNGGAFPFQRVSEQIDGALDVEAHGPRDMPIWGRDHARQAREAYPEEGYAFGRHDLDVYTRRRILALNDYLNRLQVK